MIELKKPRELVFLPVTGLDMQQIAHHIKRYSTPDAEIEFVDLSGIFDDVEPSFETHIDKLQSVMNVKKAVDFETSGVPNEVRFVVPNVDMPTSTEAELADIQFTMVRYAYIDAMPDELKRVVRAYLHLRSGSDIVGVKHFKEAVENLAKKTAETFSDPSVA